MAEGRVIRHFAFYIKGKKAATINEVAYKIMPARTPQFGGEGYLGHAEGAQMSQITVTEATPVDGSDMTEWLVENVVKGRRLQCSGVVGGKNLEFDMVVTDFEASSNTKTGEATSKATLEGAIPDVS